MKNLLIAIAGVAVLSGALYVSMSSTIFSVYFEKGDKPTQQQFQSQIDSLIHVTEDKTTAPPKDPSPSKGSLPVETATKPATVSPAKVLTQGQNEFKLDSVQDVTFRWVSDSTPAEPVHYRLKVWQLMQGQTAAQVKESGDPVVTKEVTSGSEVTVSGLYTGPCRPPYLCDFVWDVEAIAKDTTLDNGSGMISVNPASETTSKPADGTAGATQ